MLTFTIVLIAHIFTLGQPCNVTAIATPDHTCIGDITQLNTNVSSGRPHSFSWAPTTGLSNPSISNPKASPTNTINYIVTVIGSGSVNERNTITLAINPNPTANFTFTPNNQCSPMAVSFTNTSTGIGTFSFHWDFGDGNTSYQMSSFIVPQFSLLDQVHWG